MSKTRTLLKEENDGMPAIAKKKDKVKKVPTTLKLSENLWSQVKIVAIENKITATEFVEEALQKEIARVRGPKKSY